MITSYLTEKDKYTKSNMNITRVLLFTLLITPLLFMPNNYHVDFKKEAINEQNNETAAQTHNDITTSQTNQFQDTSLKYLSV